MELLAESMELVCCAGLGVSVHVWIIFYRAWLKLAVLIKSLYMCNLCLKLFAAYQTAIWLAMLFSVHTLLLL